MARGQLITRLAARVDCACRMPNVVRFAAHLDRESTAIWSFLFDPNIDAINWRAEHAIRPKDLLDGADCRQILANVIRTASHRHASPYVVASMPHRRTPSVVAELN